jgi:Ca2+-binding EF-hand superfamily protein
LIIHLRHEYGNPSGTKLFLSIDSERTGKITFRSLEAFLQQFSQSSDEEHVVCILRRIAKYQEQYIDLQTFD